MIAAAPGFDAVWQEYGPMLGRMAASYEADPARRDDLLQDIGLALWRALPGWRGDAQLKTFVARIAQHRAVDHVVRNAAQARSRQIDESHVDPMPGPEHGAALQQQQTRLLAALQRLPVAQHQVVVLALEGYAHGEIADVLGIAANAVDARLSRARRALRELLTEYPDAQ